MEDSSPLILAFDPSFTAWGFAVVDLEDNVVDFGCIKTAAANNKLRIRAGDDRIRRIDEILVALNTIIRNHDIRLVVAELPHGSQNARASIMIGSVTGIIQTFCYFHDFPIEWYSEADAKKHLLGRRTAEKSEVVEAMDSAFSGWRVGTKYKDEAVADALAIYSVAKEHSQIIKYLKSINENK